MIYRDNFLTKVIVRLDYDQQQALLTPNQPQFSRAIAATFPICSAQPINTVSFVIGQSGPSMQAAGYQWLHTRDAKATSAVTLNASFLSFEIGKGEYAHFEPFMLTIDSLISALEETTPVRTVSRIGLRYINEIELQQGLPGDWEGIVKPELRTFTNCGLIGDEPLLRSMHQVVTGSDGCQTVVNYGILNGDFPAPNARRHFILDIDSSDNNVHTLAEAKAACRELNKTATDTFEAAIEDGLRDIMGVVND